MIPPSDRKDSHLSLCLRDDIDLYSQSASGFAAYRFEHDALPEIDYDAVDLRTEILGKPLAAPLVIGAMTGGTERAGEINRRLAKAAQVCGVGLALGSQRKLLGAAPEGAIAATYRVRDTAPDLPLLFGNLGAVQLNYGVGATEIRGLIAAVACDAWYFHLNPLQEVVQPEGDRRFGNLLPRLREVIPALGIPALVKEVGAGISRATALKLSGLPLHGIETGGVGGTSWSKIESLRAEPGPQRRVGNRFARWGIPTAESVPICRAAFGDRLVIASGGIRNGIEVAKAIALGADAAALALPFLRAAEHSAEAVVLEIEGVLAELRAALFLTGCASIAELKRRGPAILTRNPDPTSA